MTSPSPSSSTRELQVGALRLAVRTDLGGSIAGFWHDGVPLLRSTAPGDLAAARQSGCYPLVPYSNRIANRRFRWAGVDHTTAPNFDDSPHSLHGVGWRRPWTVETHGEHELALGLVHQPDADWPFPFAVRQTFALTPLSLTVTLALTNTADVVQPTGLGWHPYFPKHVDSAIRAHVTDRWDPDAAELPLRDMPTNDIDALVSELDYDHCFSGWDGLATVSEPRLRLRIASDLRFLVVYTPRSKPYFCVEPVSHLSNAINRPDPLADGLRALAPGAVQTATMSFTLEPR